MKPIHIDAPRSVLTSGPKPATNQATDILVIGGGAAGLMAALRAAQHTNVTLLTRDLLLKSNSAWAQGGIAAALDATDSPLLHIEDTLNAGAGISDRAAVEMLAWEAPLLMYELFDIGVPFDRKNDTFVLGLEGNHSRRRILHVGDATGRALTSTLVNRARTNPNIRIIEGYQVYDLVCDANRCTGVLALDESGGVHQFTAHATILASGGAAALYGISSNRRGALGEGIAMAYRAGADIADMEFIQFHPTVLRTRDDKGFLISEATRGEGATLLTASGERFMPDYDPRAELAPRDIVSRGIFDAMQREASDQVLLNMTHLSHDYIQRRFPTIYTRCLQEGIDPSTTPIPVAPAAHYLMGGIRTTLDGATTLAGLYAAGECACTGVHGANRLASNSLLECLISGSHAAQAAIDGHRALNQHTSEMSQQVERVLSTTHTPHQHDHLRHRLADIMRTSAGPLRTATSLESGLNQLMTFPLHVSQPDPDAMTLANAALVAHLILACSVVREESRGAHYRVDFPTADDTWKVHLVVRQGSPIEAVATIGEMDTVTERYDTPSAVELPPSVANQHDFITSCPLPTNYRQQPVLMLQ